MNMAKMMDQRSCGLKFAFDVPTEHRLSWYERYGYSDSGEMIQAHKANKPDSFELDGEDMAGAKHVIIFEFHGKPQDYAAAYNDAVLWLADMHKNPIYNTKPDFVNQAIDYCEDEGIPTDEDMSDLEVVKLMLNHQYED